MGYWSLIGSRAVQHFLLDKNHRLEVSNHIFIAKVVNEIHGLGVELDSHERGPSTG